MAHLLAPHPPNPDLPVFFNVDAQVGAPPAPNKREDVLLVQFAFKVNSDNATKASPRLLAAAKAVKVTGIADQETITAIRVLQEELGEGHGCRWTGEPREGRLQLRRRNVDHRHPEQQHAGKLCRHLAADRQDSGLPRRAQANGPSPGGRQVTRRCAMRGETACGIRGRFFLGMIPNRWRIVARTP